MGDVVPVVVDDRPYCKISVRRDEDALIYFKRDRTSRSQLFRRGAAENVELKGVDRDGYIRQRLVDRYEETIQLLKKAAHAYEKERDEALRSLEEARSKLDAANNIIVDAGDTSSSNRLAASHRRCSRATALEQVDKTPDKSRLFKLTNGVFVDPDDVMDPDRQKAIAKASRAKRLNCDSETLSKYLRMMMKRQDLSYADLLGFVRHVRTLYPDD